MAYFPMFIDLKGKRCVIAGGGKVACRKAESLCRFEAQVEVIAPEICPELEAFEDSNREISFQKRAVEREDLVGSFLVIAATDSRKVNRMVSEFCREEDIFVNVIDSQEESTFVFPATLKREDISVGITTSGSSPFLSSSIRKTIEKAVPEYYGELSKSLGRIREKVKAEVPLESDRRKIMKWVTQTGLEKKEVLSADEVEQIIKKIQQTDDENQTKDVNQTGKKQKKI
ncbi:MAG: bifunctional precorrin-2 dehydrogenase/sirohydrochlorin ferrochelatase [Lachnospiraceae bacterium]|nr:bifunctional precorrin-2 dehydrogenase/sirohydrochlorin ferrochelatase [Lachnospiraceae bacterium]